MLEPTWTSERVELLKSHFAAGLSCREIADAIGVSRNAVIGKLSRLSLTREKKPRRARQNDEPAKKRARSVPRMQYQILRKLYAEAPPAAEETIESQHRCSLLELSKEKCRWPLSTPGLADFCFCGNVPLQGLPYCAGHTRLAYLGGYRQRAARG